MRIILFFLFIFPIGNVMSHPFKYNYNLAMDVEGGIYDGSRVMVNQFRNSDSQNFIYINGGIRPASGQNYCMTLERSQRDEDNKVVLRACNGGDNQKFTITDYTIRPADKPEECLTVRDEKILSSEFCVMATQQIFSIPRVCTYKDAYYKNMTECTNNDLSILKENDTLSSLSVVNAVGSLYENNNFNGDKLRFHDNIPFVGDENSTFNDKASSLKIADVRSFLITSDPQLVCQGNCNNISAEASMGNIRQQYEMFNKHHSDVDAVLINGDLTEYGHDHEWSKFESIIDTLKLPYYYGLGNHDMYNNYNDCWENNCLIRSITKLVHHVNSRSNVSAFDLNHTHGYVFPEVKETIRGSLSYSVDFGNVLVIQLNDFESAKNPLYVNQYSSGGAGNGAMRYIIERYQDKEYEWLERQLYSAYKKNQVVIVNQHRHDADAGNLQTLLERYKVGLRFSGHYHNSVGEMNNGFMLSGSSALGTYLKVEIDTTNRVAKIYKGTENNIVPQLMKTINLESPANNITPPAPGPIYIRVKTSGGYEAFATLVYKTKSGQRVYVDSGKLLAGNSWEYTTPSGAKIESLEMKNNTGLAWEPQKSIFKINNITDNACFATWGTTLAPSWTQVSCR